MLDEVINDNISSHSIDYLSHRQNKNLEIIIEEKNITNNNQNNFEENENKTQISFSKIPNPLLDIEQPKRYNSCEKRKKNKILQQKVKEILDYRAKFKSMEAEENLEEEILNKEEDDKKQKVESKVNRNLKLLNLIKEKMNQNKEIQQDNDNDNNKEKNDKDNNDNDIDINKKEKIIEDNNKIDENNSEVSINKNEDKNDINEEKKKKLLQIFEKKEFKKERDNLNNLENENSNDNKEKENAQEQNSIINKEKDKEIYNVNNYQKRKIPHPNAGSVSYPTFMKKGTGNFHINTPKTKQQSMKKISKSNSNDKEKDNNNNKKDNKYSDIPSDQKNKLTIKLNPKNIPFTPDNSNKKNDENSDKKENNTENKIISLRNKNEEKSNLNNNNDNKKGAMKILELLKAKKKEENENNKIEKEKDKEKEKDNNQIVQNENTNKINSSLFNKNKDDIPNITKVENQNEDGSFETRALPKKKFKEEEEEENEYPNNNYNRTQNIFRNSNKKSNPKDNNNNEKELNLYNNNNNNSSRIKTNYYNNINNNINNFFNIGDSSNIPERKTLEYIKNANLIRNKYNKKIKEFHSTNQFLNEDIEDDNEDDIFKVGNNSQINYIQQKNAMIDSNNLNIKNLDKSYEIFRTKKNPLGKGNINKNINNQKKINNNSPREVMKYKPYERNTANNFKRNGRIYNKINYRRINAAYVKKSPGKINIKNKNSVEKRHLIKFEQDYKNQNQFKPSQNLNKFNKVSVNKIKNNLDNNEGIEINTIYGLNSSIETSTSNRTNNKIIKSKETKKENTMLFNIEDLLVLEEKLNNITFALESNKNIDSQCFNFLNYYFNCSLYKILEKIFPNEEDANIIRLSINYELMSIMVCYDFAFSNNIEDEDLNLSLIELIYFNHNNLIIICEYILTKITPDNTDNIWVLKLQEIVKNSKFSQTKEINNSNNNSSIPIQKILNNTNKIIKKIKSILLNYQSDSTSLLKNYILNLPRKTYAEINNFFRSQILRIDNYEGSLVPPSFFKKNRDFTPLPAPYLKFPSAKPYTLILDLDETLVSFQIKSKKEGTLRARPFLFAFLEEMGHYYELIVWTSATEAYANSLIDAIEYDKQYFDFILFREHAIIIGDEFVKDLNRVGRGLDRIIIVDDMPQNFRLQKQNGITIKPFYGDDYNDTALYDLLPILKHIAEEGNDVRIELAKYREEIVRKITSNISLNDI